MTTPAESSGRTLLFDWLDHTGGRSDGRAIRAQVVAVPGHLPHLRARLLITADVVLFVADTSAAGLPATTAALDEVRELLAAMDEPRPGLLVQANKRDASDAVPIDEVRRRLRLGDDDVVVETVATSGAGVRQSYVYAVRLGLRHARAEHGSRPAERQPTAADLLSQLDTDPRPVPVPVATRSVTQPFTARPALPATPIADIVAPRRASSVWRRWFDRT